MKKILLVDDEEYVREAMASQLKSSGAEVYAVDSAEKGLDLLETSGPFDVLVADFRMSGMNGVELARCVRKRWPETFCVMVTGFSNFEAVHEAVTEELFVRILAKPWSQDELINSVHSAVQQSRLYRQTSK